MVAYIKRGGGFNTGLMEEAAVERIRACYRFAWSLPHTKEVLARCSNIMIWSDVDLAEGFDRPGGGPALAHIHMQYHHTILRLMRQVFREYQRQLWEPDGSASGVETHSWNPLEGQGGVTERVTLRWGPVGLVLLDPIGSKLGASGYPLHDVQSLLSGQHWRDLAATMSDDTMRALVVASPTCVLNDSPDDAVIKALQPSQMNRIMNGWPYNRDDLRRLLDALFAWKLQVRGEVNGQDDVPLRDVMLVSGGSSFGMTTQIRRKALDAVPPAPQASRPNSRQSRLGTAGSTRQQGKEAQPPVQFRQLVVPPITDEPQPPGCELRGHVDEEDTISYAHKMSRGRGFGIVKVTVVRGDVEGGRGLVDGDILIADDESVDTYELSQRLMRLPFWVESTLREAYATADDSESDVEEDEDGAGDGEAKGEDGQGSKKGGLLGSGAIAARRKLKGVFQTKAFRTAVTKTYERYSAEDGGLAKPQLLEAVRHFFYKVGRRCVVCALRVFVFIVFVVFMFLPTV